MIYFPFFVEIGTIETNLLEECSAILGQLLNERAQEGFVVGSITPYPGGLLVLMVSSPTLTKTELDKLARRHPELSGQPPAPPPPVPWPPAPA